MHTGLHALTAKRFCWSLNYVTNSHPTRNNHYFLISIQYALYKERMALFAWFTVKARPTDILLNNSSRHITQTTWRAMKISWTTQQVARAREIRIMSVTITNDAIHVTPPVFVSLHDELRFELPCVYSTIRLTEYKNCITSSLFPGSD